MSAKFPRRSFAAPLVVTLAVPACIVTSSKPAPAPTGDNGNPNGSVRDHRTDGQAEPSDPPPPPPGTMVNPPRVVDHPAPPTTTTPPPRDPQRGNGTMQQPVPPPTQQAPLRSWTVYINGKDCYTSYDVTCPPKGATCNPPPPQKLAKCPDGITADRPFKIKEDSANSCALYYPMPDCPAGVSCNPPRPQKTGCPTR
jgi:hypothetical protein